MCLVNIQSIYYSDVEEDNPELFGLHKPSHGTDRLYLIDSIVPASDPHLKARQSALVSPRASLPLEFISIRLAFLLFRLLLLHI